MQDINEFIKQNPSMKLKEIASMYNVSTSVISRRRRVLGVKHEVKNICKQIAKLLHLRNKDIATQLGCSEVLVAHIRFKEKKSPSNSRVDLKPEQIKIVKENFDKMSVLKLAQKIGVTSHVLRSRMAEMRLYNDIDYAGRFYDYDLDNGKGFFDIEKYKKIMI